MPDDSEPLVRLTLRPLRATVPADARLKLLLKVALRRLSLRCEKIEELPAGHDEPRFRAALEALDRCPPPDALYRHRRTSAVCRVEGRCLAEAALTPSVLYSEPPGSWFWWARPLAEFLERFEKISGGLS